MSDTPQSPLDRLLDAILAHVPFDGWSPEAFAAAAKDADMTLEEARVAAPRGAVDLAIAFHRRGDAAMIEAMKSADFADLRFSEKVAEALKIRIDVIGDREAVRRASALFSLPQHAGDGVKLIWETADHVWTALGDTSRDVNWYTKRATLSGVWASTVLYWLGDTSEGFSETRAFIDRRIADVMQIEKVKGKLRENPLTKPFMELQAGLFGKIKAPDMSHLNDLPGHFRGPRP